jgi:hypothetical protein
MVMLVARGGPRLALARCDSLLRDKHTGHCYQYGQKSRFHFFFLPLAALRRP